MGILLDIETLSQRDNRWTRIHLGHSNQTIGGWGCVLTSVCMQVRYHGKEIDPIQLNEAMKNVDGFFNENLWRWEYLEKVYPDIKFIGRFDYENMPADLQLLDDQLEKGQPVIVKVEADEIGTPKGTHFLIVVGKEGDDYIVNDPWWRPSDDHPKQFKISEYYSHNGSKKPEHIFLGFRIYEGAVPSKMNKFQEKALELIRHFMNGGNVKQRKFGNEESATRDLLATWDTVDSYKERIENAEESRKLAVENALTKQKALCDGEIKDTNAKWQSRLSTAKNKVEEYKKKHKNARNLAINDTSKWELLGYAMAKILKTFTPLPVEELTAQEKKEVDDL